MDFDYRSVPAQAQFEYIIETADQTENVAKMKKIALQSMNELEGWCSKYKASVLIDLILMLKPQIIVEIGVFGGKSLIPMAYALKENGMGAVYGIDPWDSAKSIEGMDGANKEYWNKVDHDAILQGLKRKIKKFNLVDQIELIRRTSEDAPLLYNIDILHIDGNHSDVTSLFDVNKWVPLMNKGGLIIFDDINWASTKTAVKWLDDNCIKMAEFKGDNMWGIWIKP